MKKKGKLRGLKVEIKDKLKKYKEEYLKEDKSDKALFEQTLNPEKFLESIKNNKLIIENELIFNKAIKIFEEFLKLLREKGVYTNIFSEKQPDKAKVDKFNLDMTLFSYRLNFLQNTLLYLASPNNPLEKVSKNIITYILLNIYRSNFEISKSPFYSLIKDLSYYLKDENTKCNAIYKIVLKDKHSIGHFIELIGYIDQKFKTSFKKDFLEYVDVNFRNMIAHEDYLLKEDSVINKKTEKIFSRLDILNKDIKLFIFIIAGLYNKEANLSPLWKLISYNLDLNELSVKFGDALPDELKKEG